MISPDQLRAIEERCSKATPGPWHIFCRVGAIAAPPLRVSSGQRVLWYRELYDAQDEANFELAAHARTDLPALVQEVKRLREVAAWAQAVLTALNVGDVRTNSPLHLKLREVMIAYREHKL